MPNKKNDLLKIDLITIKYNNGVLMLIYIVNNYILY
jgi:hypothetical protein